MKTLVCTLLGLGLGGAVGYYFGKKCAQKEAEKRIAELENYYEISDRYRRCPKEEEESENSSGGENRENGPLSGEKRAEIKKKLGKNWAETTNYAAKYHKNGENEAEIEKETPAMAANRWHEENKDREPEAISETALTDVPGFIDRQTLYYYAYDETLTDEDNVVIDDVEMVLGTTIEDTGFIDDDTERLLVLNYQTDCVYVVEKFLASYTEATELAWDKED